MWVLGLRINFTGERLWSPGSRLGSHGGWRLSTEWGVLGHLDRELDRPWHVVSPAPVCESSREPLPVS